MDGMIQLEADEALFSIVAFRDPPLSTQTLWESTIRNHCHSRYPFEGLNCALLRAVRPGNTGRLLHH